MTVKVSATEEDYLEAIHELIQSQGIATTGSVAKKVGVHPSTATRMLSKLDKHGLVHIVPYSNVTLSETGEVIGRQVQQRHRVLDDFLKLLGIDDDQVRNNDIEGLEHHLSEQTLHALEALTTYLKEHPRYER